MCPWKQQPILQKKYFFLGSLPSALILAKLSSSLSSVVNPVPPNPSSSQAASNFPPHQKTETESAEQNNRYLPWWLPDERIDGGFMKNLLHRWLLRRQKRFNQQIYENMWGPNEATCTGILQSTLKKHLIIISCC